MEHSFLTAHELWGLIEPLAQAVWETDASGQVIVDSPTWRAYTGQTLADWLGEGWGRVVHPDDRAFALGQWQQAVRQQTPVNAEFRIASPDGSWQWTNVRAIPVYQADGTVGKWIGLNLDIHDRKVAEEALRESEAQFRLMADTVPQIIWWVDADGRNEFFNKPWYHYTGADNQPMTVDEVTQRFVHSEDRPLTLAAFAQASQKGLAYQVEHRIRSAAGTYRWFLVRAEPYRDPQTGAITRWFGASVDIDDRKRAEEALLHSEAGYRQLSAELEQQVQQRTQQLQESVLDLQRSNEDLQQFAYIASHDLQEPLRKIQQFGDLLKTQYAPASGEALVYLDRMQSAAARMSILIKDLLNFSRITNQQDKRIPVSLEQVMKDVLSDIDLLRMETQARIEVAPLPVVEGEARQLGQLFQNLLGNALKFRRMDTSPVIHVKSKRVWAHELPAGVKPTRPVEAYYQIEVIDNGIGFDEKYVDRIFQVFQRLHGQHAYGGTGIGLAICAKVVANHGGAITARSQPGQGATFKFYLPA
ncbi:hypothetical protein GCM10028818_52310 [Spirosoma horti]